MDRIFIRDLRADALIGTLEREKRFRQGISADLELFLDLHPAGKSGELDKSVDYSEIARRAREIMEGGHFGLLEELATALGAMVMEYPPVVRVAVRLDKPRAVYGARVGVEMEFGRGEEF